MRARSGRPLPGFGPEYPQQDEIEIIGNFGGQVMATVGQLMTSNLLSVGEGESIQDAAKVMHARRIGSLLVKNDDEFTGIITETDVVKAVAEQPGNIEGLTVEGVMSSPIITVERKMSPHYARDLMADRKIRHLAVIDQEAIIGIVSVRDLLAYFKTVSKELAEDKG